jgi:hypothetical protein
MEHSVGSVRNSQQFSEAGPSPSVHRVGAEKTFASKSW